MDGQLLFSQRCGPFAHKDGKGVFLAGFQGNNGLVCQWRALMQIGRNWRCDQRRYKGCY